MWAHLDASQVIRSPQEATARQRAYIRPILLFMKKDIPDDMNHRIPEIDLRQLRSFVAVAQRGHFGKAAAYLGVAQPPLSQQIQRLEDRVGYRLFQRKGRGIALTPAGTALLTTATRALSQVAEGLEEARRVGRGEAGHLRIGFAGSVALTVLPPVIQAFRDRYPAVNIDLVQKTTTPQIADLRSGMLDVGFLREAPPHDSDLAHATIYREPLIALLPCSHALAQRSSIAPGELAHEPFVTFHAESGPAFYERIVRVCHVAGFMPHLAQVTGEWLTIAGLVAAGAGVSIAPECIAHIRLPGLAFVRLKTTDTVEITLAWRQGDMTQTISNFSEIAMEVGQSLLGQGQPFNFTERERAVL
jgi:DNA-binding transcriptional LysR family regulator